MSVLTRPRPRARTRPRIAESGNRVLVAAVSAVLLASGGLAAGGGSASAAPPAPPGEVSKARLLSYLGESTGRHMLSGQQDGPNNNPAQWEQKVHDITGEYPGMWGGDFGFSQNDIDNRQKVVDQAKKVWSAGSIPAMTMHACRPDVATCDFEGGSDPVKGSRLSDEEWTEVLTDGAPLNEDYKRKLDQFVPYFQQLEDAGIPVLFRPLHEMNEGWAWWGGRSGENGSAALFRLTRDYLESQGFDNIVWVWNVKDIDGQAARAADFYPGDDYADLVTLDAWWHDFPTDDWYRAVRDIAGDKPIALAEVGKVPNPSAMASQPEWAYWSVWTNYLVDHNTGEEVKAGYYDPRVLNRGEVDIPAAGR
ncbi:glycosyl hydrolase [Streptomyces physcomitrii]|uniref:glycoside hydrolase family 26 protein n=1 Tax=Streptomyces physcomitrii TaxID=2724184 RepID=UPI0033E4EC36